MTSRLLLCALALCTTIIAPATAGDGADLTAYIESIRAAGMSETAQSQLRSVASIVCAASILKYIEDKDSGQYWPSYTSATCPNPNADAPELTKWKQVKKDESAETAQKLKPFADADGSGFVTTQEGSDFRYLIEFGFLADQVTHEQQAGLDAIARASGTDLAAAEKRVRDYAAISKRIADAGIGGLPQLNVPGLVVTDLPKR